MNMENKINAFKKDHLDILERISALEAEKAPEKYIEHYKKLAMNIQKELDRLNGVNL